MTKINKKVMITIVLLTASACLICAMSDGIKNNYGIMLNSIIENSGLTYSYVSLVLAVGQLFYGIMQPTFGVLAEKKGNTLTLLIGVSLTLIGLVLLPKCTNAFLLMLILGFFLPAGTGATSYGILIGSISPKIPAKTVSLVSGFVNASSGVGNALLSPVITYFLNKGGLAAAMFILVIPTIIMIPLCFYVGRKQGSEEVESVEKEEISVVDQFKDALSNRSYQLLMVGFFTCGFHMALISNHLPSQIVSYGITSQTSSYAFSVYGIITMLGSVFSGYLCGKLIHKNVLGTYYGSRSIITIVFLLLPKNLITIFGYAALLGMTGAATVPPVTSIINDEFGADRLASLYGFVFFIHSIGGFLGAWLAGICVDYFGGYVLIWIVDIVLSAIAAIASYAIKPLDIKA